MRMQVSVGIATCLTVLLSSACASNRSAARDDTQDMNSDETLEGADSTDESFEGTEGAEAEDFQPDAQPDSSGDLRASVEDESAPARKSSVIDDDNPLPPEGESARGLYDDGVSLIATNPSAAVGKFVAAAKAIDNFYAAMFNAGVAAEAANDNATAEKHYKASLAIRPGYSRALINLYLLYGKTNRSSEANRVIDSALQKHGDKAGPHVAAAFRHRMNGRNEDVRREALNAIHIDERQVPAMQMMATVFYEEGRYETARFALENALRLEPGNALLHLELGHVLLKLDEKKRALTEFKSASGLRPDLAEAHENYGVLVLDSGDADAAAAAFERVVRLKPNSAVAYMHLGNAQRTQKKLAEAVAAYDKALQLDPALHDVHFNKAIMCIDNEVPGMEYLARLKMSQDEFALYKSKAADPGRTILRRIEDYEKTLKKRIRREEKKVKRDAQRKAIAEEEAAEAAAKAAEAPESETANEDGTTTGDAEAGTPENDGEESETGTPAADAEGGSE